MLILYVPCLASFKSKVLRSLPRLTFSNAIGAPSGPVTTTPSSFSGWWSISNKPSEIAASTVIQASFSSSTVDDGSNHGLCACALTAAPASNKVINDLDSLFMIAALWFQHDGDGAQFFLAAGGQVLRGGRRPLQRHLDLFAAAGFARRLQHQLVLAGRQLRSEEH